MPRDLETLLAKVRKSMEESKAMIAATRQMVERSRHLLHGPGQVAESAGFDVEEKAEGTSADPVGDSPEKASGEP